MVENWPAKALSIAVALILFVFHQMSITATRPLSVNLAIETGSAMIPASPYPHNVRLQLRGEDDGIKTITDSDIEAYADFSRYESEGWYSAPVQIRRKGSALEVEPLEISVHPMEVSVYLDVRVVKTLPLTADVRGMTASGFNLEAYSIFPAEVVVSGPLGILDNIHEIKTDTIDLGGRNGDFSLMVDIINPNRFISLRGSGMAEFHGRIRPVVPVRIIESEPEPDEENDDEGEPL
jgi:hypothetical protein